MRFSKLNFLIRIYFEQYNLVLEWKFPMELSKFGNKITSRSGIGDLMDDLGAALSSGGDWAMLGGGNPAHIPAMEKVFRMKMQAMLDRRGEFESCVGDYDSPEGNLLFRRELADLLSYQYGWKITHKNIALTNGSQAAFFTLFNLFAGEFSGGDTRKIMLPIVPEYIGYSDVGLLCAEEMFSANRPRIEFIGDDMFKYRIDFDNLKLDDNIGAICVSRPTNPTGNVLSDQELEKLSQVAIDLEVPLIIDNAYGFPFPGVIFTDAKPFYNSNTILCMSLSKFGLPGLRTGIVVASEEIISWVGKSSSILTLAPGSMAASLTTEMVTSGEIIKLSQQIVKPYYEEKVNVALEIIRAKLKAFPVRIHKPEGAFFLWLWFENLPITSKDLYQKLKSSGVLIIPGEDFYPGMTSDWQHRFECIRINYAQPKEVVETGITKLAELLAQLY